MKKTAGESTEKDVTEAKLNVQLMPVGGGKPRLTTTTEGNDGGIGFKTGLRLARAAAMMYLRYASPLAAMNTMSMMNMGGMGMVGNPMLMQMQGAGVMGTGRTFDRTAGAAMFMMDAMATGSSRCVRGSVFRRVAGRSTGRRREEGEGQSAQVAAALQIAGMPPILLSEGGRD